MNASRAEKRIRTAIRKAKRLGYRLAAGATRDDFDHCCCVVGSVLIDVPEPKFIQMDWDDRREEAAARLGITRDQLDHVERGFEDPGVYRSRSVYAALGRRLRADADKLGRAT